MKSVFLLQWQRLRRAPILVLSMVILTVAFVAVLGGFGPGNTLTVPTYSDNSLSEDEREFWLDRLNEADGIEFEWAGESEAKQWVAEGSTSVAVQIMEDDYRMLVAADDASHYGVERHVNQIYSEELRLREAEQYDTEGDFREEVERGMEEPALSLITTNLEGEEGTYEYNEQLQILFGMTLFFSIYTILFSLYTIVEEKRGGTWDRLIISPLHKWQIYLGHLLYCFFVGYAQIVIIFVFFQYVFGFDIGERFGTILIITACYTFAIVALGMLLIGAVNSPQQLQAVIPIVATAIAMIGGAFWPIEVVTNEIMLALSKGVPMLYAIDALKGAAIFDRSFLELGQPLSIMLLFGVVCMGVGINLMERRGS
ncbi:ABC transporter permease [Evansella halocellulosilytica]|uniref:ABC transporter permease n=1 Tax=Evansella halocellulosilytica TaxID=2011013 RepID=UPI000BB79B06|nr:ABC transporter permease [Evansella halocellulosilytica]